MRKLYYLNVSSFEEANLNMSVIRYSPFADLEASFTPGLRVFQDSVNRLFSEPSNRPWVPAVDIHETENELIV